MPKIPDRFKRFPGAGRAFKKAVAAVEKAEKRVEEVVEAAKPVVAAVAPVVKAAAEMPDYAALTVAKLKELVPAEAQAQFSNKLKATYVGWLVEEWKRTNG